MLISTSFPGSQHSRGSVQALLIMMPFRFIVISLLGSLFRLRIQFERQGMQIPAQLSPVMQNSFFNKLGNFLQNQTIALQLSTATVPSSCFKPLLDVLNPTPPGDEIYSKLFFMFQEKGLISNSAVPSLKKKGPFSQLIPMRLEHPGPPLSQRMRGSLSGSRCESKNTQWNVAVSKSSIPEYHLWSVQPFIGIRTQSSRGAAKAKARRAKINRYFIKDLQQLFSDQVANRLKFEDCCLYCNHNKIIKYEKIKKCTSAPLGHVTSKVIVATKQLIRNPSNQITANTGGKKSFTCQEKFIRKDHIARTYQKSETQQFHSETIQRVHENQLGKYQICRQTQQGRSLHFEQIQKIISITIFSYLFDKKEQGEGNNEVELKNIQQAQQFVQYALSSCPYVNTQKINEQYQKIKKIGNRLRKYDNSCELKTKKYMRTSTLSITTNLRFSAPQKQRTLKPKLTNFYNKEDILKNKIQNRGIPSAKFLLRELQNRKLSSEQKYYEFFNTQVNPQMEHP